MVIIDTEVAKPLTGCECVAATFDNISAFANRELPDDFPKEFTDEVMNPEFQAFYKLHHEAAQNGFLEAEWSTDTKLFAKYLATTPLNDSDKNKLIERMEMHKAVGNNQHYLGNGVTEDKIPKSNNKCGAVELITSSERPQICKN